MDRIVKFIYLLELIPDSRGYEEIKKSDTKWTFFETKEPTRATIQELKKIYEPNNE